MKIRKYLTYFLLCVFVSCLTLVIYRRHEILQKTIILQQIICRGVDSGRVSDSTKPTMKTHTSPTTTSSNSDIEKMNSLPFTDGGIAPHEFTFTIKSENLCSNVGNLTYFVFVFTRPKSFKIRSQVRETWGQRNLLRGIQGRVAFLLGSTNDTKVTANVKKESNTYGDIIQQDFHDSYRNLSLKGIMASRWIHTYCKNAKYIIKVDDDVILNIIKMTEFLHYTVGASTRSIYCYILGPDLRKHFVIRPNSTQAKLDPQLVVKRSQFSGSMYPEYCHGMLWVSTNDIFEDLYNASYKVPFAPVEDAYTTGILRDFVKDIKIVMHHEFYKTVGVPISNLEAYNRMGIGLPIAVNVQKRYYKQAWELMLSRLPKNQKSLVRKSFWKTYRYKHYRPYWFKPPP